MLHETTINKLKATANELYNEESNWNNADRSSCQCVRTEEDIYDDLVAAYVDSVSDYEPEERRLYYDE